MTVSEFISKQDHERQDLLKKIHGIIIAEDKTVKAEVGSMMGKEMIIYNQPGSFKYGLASVKNYMSLHAMPIYGSEKLHSRYKELLPTASLQKGCINFKNKNEMPLDIVKLLIADCAKVDMQAIREAYLKSKKEK